MLIKLKSPGSFSQYFLFVGLALCVASLLVRGVIIFQSNYYNLAYEGLGLYGILDVAEGKELYKTRGEHPFSVYVFTPLFAEGVGRFIKVLGVKNLKEQVFMIKGIDCILALSLVLMFFVCGARKQQSFFLVVLGLLLSSSRLIDYIPTTRNDTASLVCEMLVFWSFLLFISREKNRYLALFIGFSVFSVWVRQTGMIVFLSGLVWLLLRKEYSRAFLCALIFGSVNLILLLLFSKAYGELFWDHIFFSNVRLWKSLDRSLLNLSLATFVASLLVFGALLLKQWRQRRLVQSQLNHFVWIVFALGTCIGSVTLLRAGGDINYFFTPLFFGTYLILSPLSALLRRPEGRVAVGLQLSLIALMVGYKSLHMLSYSQLPFDEMSKKVRAQFPNGFGLVTGSLGIGMMMNLKNWVYQGPEITTGCFLSRSAHPRLHWLYEDAVMAMEEGTVKTILQVEKNCAAEKGLKTFLDKEIQGKEVLADWVCAYHVR